MINIYGIYFQNELIYIGQTCKSVSNRFSTHKSTAISRPSACPKLYAKMNKHGHDNFNAVLLHTVDEAVADEIEIRLIKEHNLIESGCNVALGGRVNRGMVKTEDQRQRSREVNKDRFSQGLGLAAWNGTEAQKKMLSEKFKGREVTWGDKITEAKSGGPYIILLDNVEYTTSSINKFAKEYGLNTATMRNSLWNSTTCRSKGRTISVRHAA